jgi:hypothetical protein
MSLLYGRTAGRGYRYIMAITGPGRRKPLGIGLLCALARAGNFSGSIGPAYAFVSFGVHTRQSIRVYVHSQGAFRDFLSRPRKSRRTLDLTLFIFRQYCV